MLFRCFMPDLPSAELSFFRHGAATFCPHHLPASTAAANYTRSYGKQTTRNTPDVSVRQTRLSCILPDQSFHVRETLLYSPQPSLATSFFSLRSGTLYIVSRYVRSLEFIHHDEDLCSCCSCAVRLGSSGLPSCSPPGQCLLAGFCRPAVLVLIVRPVTKPKSPLCAD